MIENLSDKTFEPAEVSFKQDIDYIVNESAYACTFKSTKESALLYVEAQDCLVERYKAAKNERNSCFLVMFLLGLFVVSFIYSKFGDKIGDGFTFLIFLVMLALVGVIYKRIYPWQLNVFTLKIDDHNCNNYQLRRMKDDKFCIICGSNFNEDNETTGEAYIAEVEPTYSDLIILEKVEYIEELKHGVIIRGNTTIRKYEPHKKYNKYTQMEGQVAMDVFVQKGVYPEDMLENIGDEISPN